MRSAWAALAVLTTLAWAAPAAGQERPTFRASADLVVLHVTVRDSRGAYVGGLAREHFTVFEDSRRQEVGFFVSDDAPATVGLVVDSSASMHATRPLVLAAADAFARASHPEDELFALSFNERVRSALPADAPFTRDAGALVEALDRAVVARGRTALYDAILEGLAYVERGRHDRKVLVVVSDGDDNASRATLEEVILQTQASNAVIYSVALVDPAERSSRHPRTLRRLAGESGGELFAPRRVDEIGEALARIARDIRHTYTLGYVSSNDARDGSYRRVEVRVASPDGRRLLVRTRAGYLSARAVPGADHVGSR